MDKFLKLDAEFTQDAKVFKRIMRKIVFKDAITLDSYLSLIKLPLFKKLLYNDFYKSDELRASYEEIVRKETSGVEKMIFQLLCKRPVGFKDIKLKFLFYKEFPDQREYFVNENPTVIFEAQDLLFRQVYFHENVKGKMQNLIQKSPFKHKIFFILAMKNCLSLSFMKDVIFNIKEHQSLIRKEFNLKDSEFFKYWVLALKSLPEKEFYAIVTSEMVYSPFIEKIQLLRAVEDLVSHQKLSLCILKECFNSELPIVRIYVVFLKITEMLCLAYGFKLKLLYSWLRYFLYERQIDLFFDLMGKHEEGKEKRQGI
ncbi:uncharacterized protein VICG_01299 [Vittaforma corneae ATCC 50505]|uniref:Uncharacterized protein n=1 Tax=Vittaforma corneae (strain ATCC 50505) TaxID=993615 RepID=L2GLE5_VITCO|nr:uncharacterized protein VICG_01299 [Vittaforma corneae ATCC 50505]ELA41666.1 hypothetical protein VICG_01299 [Vittaforma corneae ATCC 50505]